MLGISHFAAALTTLVCLGQFQHFYCLAITARSDSDATLLGLGCEEDAASAICFGNNREQVLLPAAVPAGIVGLWTFDVSASGHLGQR